MHKYNSAVSLHLTTFSLSLHPSPWATGVAHSMLCYCTETGGGLPPFPCIHNLTCSSSHGCYLMRFYSDRFQRIVQRWDCIDNLHNIQHQLNYTAILCDSKQNSHTSAIHCCFTDFCNNDTRLILPMELEPMTPSPTANTTRPGKPGERQCHVSLV